MPTLPKVHIIGEYAFFPGMDGVVDVYYRGRYHNAFDRDVFVPFCDDCRGWLVIQAVKGE